MYKDVKMKESLYREKILKDNISKGIYPTEEEVRVELSKKDLFSSVFSPDTVRSGDYLNQEFFNESQDNLKDDLEIMYKCLKSLCVEEYISLQSYLLTQSRFLKNKSESLLNNYNQFANFSALGDTVFSKTDDFILENDINSLKIDLGNVNYMPNSNIAVIVEGSNLDYTDIKITIGDQSVLPYNISKSKLRIPNENIKTNKHTFKIENNEKRYYPVIIPIETDNELKDNLYYISSGINKVLVKTTSGADLMPINELYFDEESFVEFYVVGSKEIDISSNKEFIDTNFNSKMSPIKLNDYSNRVYMHVEKGTVLKINSVPGSIYATRTKGSVVNDILYYNEPYHDNDFYIDEIKNESRISLKTHVNIYKSQEVPININKIIIKESMNIGGDIDDKI